MKIMLLPVVFYYYKVITVSLLVRCVSELVRPFAPPSLKDGKRLRSLFMHIFLDLYFY